MSDPIQETTETNSSRRKGLEAWAASIAARQQPPGPPPGPEQDNSGAGYTRPGASQRIEKIKAVTGIQKSHQTQKNTDGVSLSRNTAETPPELSLKEARELMKNVGTAKAQGAAESKAAQPPPPVTQAPEAKVEKSIERAGKQEAAKEAQTVTAEEVQHTPVVANAVSSKSVKSTGKTEQTETSKPEVEETEEEQEAESLIKPGNDTRASAYVRAGDLLKDGTSNPELDDYMLAL